MARCSFNLSEAVWPSLRAGARAALAPHRKRDWFDRRAWRNGQFGRMDCHHCDARVTERIVWL